MSDSEKKKYFIDFEKREPFECLRKPNLILSCWKDEKGEINICHRSPCPLNEYRFEIHERIISHYLNVKNWDEAYYYFSGLLSHFETCEFHKPTRNPNQGLLSKIQSILGKISPTNGKNQALLVALSNIVEETVEGKDDSCKIFTEKDRLRKMLDFINEEAESEKGTAKKLEVISMYKSLIMSSFKNIELIALSNRAKEKKIIREMQYNLGCIGTATGQFDIEALNLPIPDPVKEALTKRNKGPKSSTIK